MRQSARTAGRSVVGRAFEVLRCIASARGNITLSEISRETSLPVGTVHRYLQELLDETVISQASDGSYCLGRFAHLLGTKSSWQSRTRRYAMPILKQLSARTEQAVALTTFEENNLYVVQGVWGDFDDIVISPSGSEVPISLSSAGRVLLAQYANRMSAYSSDHVAPDPLRLPENRLSKINRYGYDIALGELFEQQATISVALTAKKTPHYALSILAPLGNGEVDRYAPLLQRAGNLLSRVIRPQLASG